MPENTAAGWAGQPLGAARRAGGGALMPPRADTRAADPEIGVARFCLPARCGCGRRPRFRGADSLAACSPYQRGRSAETSPVPGRRPVGELLGAATRLGAPGSSGGPASQRREPQQAARGIAEPLRGQEPPGQPASKLSRLIAQKSGFPSALEAPRAPAKRRREGAGWSRPSGRCGFERRIVGPQLP